MAAKRKAFDIETKYNALNDIQKGDKSRQAIASEYGISLTHSCEVSVSMCIPNRS